MQLHLHTMWQREFDGWALKKIIALKKLQEHVVRMKSEPINVSYLTSSKRFHYDAMFEYSNKDPVTHVHLFSLRLSQDGLSWAFIQHGIKCYKRTSNEVVSEYKWMWIESQSWNRKSYMRKVSLKPFKGTYETKLASFSALKTITRSANPSCRPSANVPSC